MLLTNVARLRTFLTAFAPGAGVILLIASSAFAQQSSPTPEATAPTARAFDANGAPLPNPDVTTERVIVTGSNIPTAQEVGANPVVNISRDVINKSGERTVEELLRNNPIANANGVPVSNNENGSNTAVGAASIALRGFDGRATLVLLDGRRVAPYPMGNAGGTVRVVFVDLNSIPQAAIESIEILKDGASTTYGADAVAGVVNVKLRKDYHGAEASVEYGNTTDKDSGLYAASVVFGVGNGTTNISGVMNFYHRNSIANRDRDYSAVPPFLSSNASPYNLQLSKAAVAEAGGTVLPGPGTTEFAGAPTGTNGLAPASSYLYDTRRIRAGGGLLPGFNFNQFSLSFPESERYGGYVSFDHKIAGEQMVLYGDAYYQNVKTHNELAAPATGSFQSAGQTTLAIPPRVANPAGTTPFGGPTYAETGVTPGAFNPFNPFNQIISGGTRARLAEFGNRKFDNETDAFLGTIGLRGDKLINGTWGYDSAFRYSQIKNTQTGTQVSATAFNRIVNQADPIFNPNSPQFIGTTTAFNPFGDYRFPIPANQQTLAFATVHPKDIDTSKLATLDATIYTTALVDLPAGGVGFALGGQFRRENVDEAPDRLNVQGDIVGNSPVSIAHGGRKDYAVYTETSIPIFSPTNAIAGFHALEFTAAARFEAFLNNDTNVLVPKVGVRWQPLDESLTLRATWGEGFREPALEELYSAPSSGLQLSHDPRNGGLLESETNVLTSSNPNLQPEDSRSISFGAVYTPKYAPGLNLSLDFWRIERTGVVNAPTADQVLAREATNSLLPGERVERDAGGFITRIVLADQNAGFEQARGIDAGIQYQKETSFGTFTSLSQVSYLDEFLFQQVAGAPILNLISRTTDEGASNEGYYRWKGDSRLDWAWNGFDLIGTVRYINGFKEFTANADALGNPVNHYVSQRFLFDLQASYEFSFSETKEATNYGKDGKGSQAAAAPTNSYPLTSWKGMLNGLRITVGVNNLFDKDPPQAFGEGGNAVGYPGFTYDATGRFVYVRLTKKF